MTDHVAELRRVRAFLDQPPIIDAPEAVAALDYAIEALAGQPNTERLNRENRIVQRLEWLLAGDDVDVVELCDDVLAMIARAAE